MSAYVACVVLTGNVLFGKALWCFGQISLWKQKQQMLCIAFRKLKGKIIVL